MKTIFKYQIKIDDEQTVKLPVGAQILTAQMQDGQLCLWAKVDRDQQLYQSFKIYVHGTGHPIINDTAVYLSTVSFCGLVFHIFYKNI